MNAIVPATTTRLPARAPAAPSLRQVAQSHAWLAAERRDADLLPLVTAEAAALLPAALAETDELLHAADPELIIVALAPVLTLVAPSGMSEDDREEWFAAAADALRGIPGDLLYRGLRVARASVDHPAKVVPTIISTISATWARRRADRSNLSWLIARLDQPKPQPVEVCTPEEARAILMEVGIRPSAAPRAAAPAPRPEPTIADYVARGLSEGEARQAIADRQRMLRRGSATPIGEAAATVGREIAA